MTNKFVVAVVSLSTLLIGQSVWAVNKLQTFTKSPNPSASITQDTNLQTTSVMGLTSESVDLKVGQNFEIDLYVEPSAGNKIQALDALIKFDKDALVVSQITPLIDPQTAEYPQSKFDNASGKVWISTILPQNLISEKTPIAKITVTPIKDGSTVISFDFQKGKTTDSNVVLENQTMDSLDSVQDITLNISQ